jgi:hypothetical protein
MWYVYSRRKKAEACNHWTMAPAPLLWVPGEGVEVEESQVGVKLPNEKHRHYPRRNCRGPLSRIICQALISQPRLFPHRGGLLPLPMKGAFLMAGRHVPPHDTPPRIWSCPLGLQVVPAVLSYNSLTELRWGVLCFPMASQHSATQISTPGCSFL